MANEGAASTKSNMHAATDLPPNEREGAFPKVRKINTRPQFGSPIFRTGHGSVSGFRVAAYARVSTDLEEQNSSFEAQKDYYERLINETPGWTFAGIYADRGISGTSTDHRAGFQAMMEDCRAGKIDRILTKSVSRFARNTVVYQM